MTHDLHEVSPAEPERLRPERVAVECAPSASHVALHDAIAGTRSAVPRAGAQGEHHMESRTPALRRRLSASHACAYLYGRVSVIAFCLVLVAIAWWLALARIGQERDEALQSAARQNANLALAYEEHVTRTLRGVDQQLLAIERAVEQGAPRAELAWLMRQAGSDSAVYTLLGVVDRRGYVVGTGDYVGDRDYFVAQRARHGLGLFIGKPVRGRASGRWIIPLSRRLEHADGRFAGIVLAAVLPEYFSNFYAKARLGRNASVLFMGLDGIAWVRRAGEISTAGVDMRASTMFARVQAQPEKGSFLSVGRIEGVPRLFSYRRVSQYPAVLAVGTALDEILAVAEQRKREYLFAASALTVAALLFLAAYLLVSFRHRRSVLALADSQNILAASQRIARLGSWEIALRDVEQLEANPVLWSDEVFRILGYEPGEVEASAALYFRLVHDEDRQRVRQSVAHAVRSTGSWSMEHRIVRPDGEVRVLHGQGEIVGEGPPAGRTRMIGTIRDITEQKRLEHELMQHANYDALTGLPNRRLFYDRLLQALSRARHDGAHLAVLLLDIDKFKTVNDTLGHSVGDDLLRELSVRLLSCVRPADTVARVGGDEFAVIAPQLAAADATQIAQRIFAVLEAPVLLHGHEIVMTASIGIAGFAGDSADVDALLKNADTAMYLAKEAGPNEYCVYAAPMDQKALTRLLMVGHLRRAIERDEFTLVFQPKIDLRTRRVTGTEALLRWTRDGAEVAPPAEFVPILETSGLVIPVGDWVIRSACRQLRAWIDEGFEPLPVAINVSARQFHHHDLAGAVQRAVAASGVAPHLLQIEITESTVMRKPDETVATIGRLRALGVSFAIDDFGTGYSSLNYLKRFPIQAVKIDRSFIDGLPDGDDAAIARAIITMAHSLQLKVVAEGVESDKQYRFLLEHGCDEMQGFHFSMPLAPAAFADRMWRHPSLAPSAR